MGLMSYTRKLNIWMLRESATILKNILADVSQEDASTYRDGPDGWTVLEVLHHVKDFDGFFLDRAQMILDKDYPKLASYDHEAIAIERAYNQQDLQVVLDAFLSQREEVIAFFEGLDEYQWERAGHHPESGYFPLTRSLLQYSSHTMTHIEQITRILNQR
ncbi:hypothetical protein MASR2M15_00870 [Anaerolineales bacterium]